MTPLLLDIATVLMDAPAPGGIEQGPEPEDVKAGWTAFAIFFGLCGVVALLCWSFVHRIRNAKQAKDAGVYGDEPADPTPERDETPDRA